MTNQDFPTIDPFKVDSKRVLETVVSELELLCNDTPVGTRSDLIQLHAALLVYELGGEANLLPTIALGLSARRLLELRVLKAARRMMNPRFGGATPEDATLRAAATIETLIHLIDPELRVAAA